MIKSLELAIKKFKTLPKEQQELAAEVLEQIAARVEPWHRRQDRSS